MPFLFSHYRFKWLCFSDDVLRALTLKLNTSSHLLFQLPRVAHWCSYEQILYSCAPTDILRVLALKLSTISHTYVLRCDMWLIGAVMGNLCNCAHVFTFVLRKTKLVISKCQITLWDLKLFDCYVGSQIVRLLRGILNGHKLSLFFVKYYSSFCICNVLAPLFRVLCHQGVSKLATSKLNVKLTLKSSIHLNLKLNCRYEQKLKLKLNFEFKQVKTVQ